MDSSAAILAEHLLNICPFFTSARCVGQMASTCQTFCRLITRHNEAIWQEVVLRVCGYPVVNEWTHLTPLERIQHTLSPFFAKPKWFGSDQASTPIMRLRCDSTAVVAEHSNDCSAMYTFSKSGPAEVRHWNSILSENTNHNDAMDIVGGPLCSDEFNQLLPLLKAAGFDESYYRPSSKHHFNLLRVHSGMHCLIYRNKHVLWVYGFATHDGRFLRRYIIPATAAGNPFFQDPAAEEFQIQTCVNRHGKHITEPPVFATAPGVVCLGFHQNQIVTFSPFDGTPGVTLYSKTDTGICDLYWRMWADPCFRTEVPPPHNYDNMHRSATLCFVHANNLAMLQTHRINWKPDCNGDILIECLFKKPTIQTLLLQALTQSILLSLRTYTTFWSSCSGPLPPTPTSCGSSTVDKPSSEVPLRASPRPLLRYDATSFVVAISSPASKVLCFCSAVCMSRSTLHDLLALLKLS